MFFFNSQGYSQFIEFSAYNFEKAIPRDANYEFCTFGSILQAVRFADLLNYLLTPSTYSSLIS